MKTYKVQLPSVFGGAKEDSYGMLAKCLEESQALAHSIGEHDEILEVVITNFLVPLFRSKENLAMALDVMAGDLFLGGMAKKYARSLEGMDIEICDEA